MPLIEYLPVLVLLVYCLVDVAQTPRGRSRRLPRRAWAAIILLVPVLGGVAWLVAGRPRREPRPSGTGADSDRVRPSRPVAPDDDDEFLTRLSRTDSESPRQDPGPGGEGESRGSSAPAP